jgi:hypothetical protein
MDNKSVIVELKKCVAQLEVSIDILVDKRNNTTSGTPEGRKQRRELTRLITQMIAEQTSLNFEIDERESATHSIPPLSPALVAKFTEQMEKLNLVIQANQNFDKIVAIAEGINSAATEIKTTTA